jgi:hypothetical protein
MRIARALAAYAGFLAVLGLVYYVDISFFRVDVVFYASLRDALIATLACAAALFLSRRFAVLGTLEKLQLCAMFLMTGYIFAISVPTVIDRSLSFYILEKIQQRGGGIALDKFDYIFTNEFMREYRVVDARLTEQTASGTIVIENGCVKLTPKGEAIATFGQFFRKHLLPKQRLIGSAYTDQLTNPFERSDKTPDYLCH